MTGASGHVGGAVARHLVASGAEVIAVGRRGSGVEGIAGERPLDLADPGLDPATVAALVAEPIDALVHAAAAIHEAPDAPAITAVNCRGTQVMLAAAELLGAQRLVFVSSVSVIGTPKATPIDEGHPTDPPTAYHASKLFGEHLMALAASRGLAAASLRITSPVGPGLRGGTILSAFAQRALAGLPLEVAGRGTRRQDYVDARDVATAIEAAIERRATGVINIASGRPIANAELARRCVAVTGSGSAIELGVGDDPSDDVSWEVSIERAATVLGYRPRHDLDDSIGEYCAEIRA